MPAKKARKDFETSWETITPAEAEHLLSTNSKNRNVNPRHVARIARDLTEGTYLKTGDAIRLDPDGQLIDGQHRLHAVIASGVPMETLVIWGIPRDAQVVMDTVVHKRSIADVITMQRPNVPGATHASVVVRNTLQYQVHGGRFGIRGTYAVTNQDYLDWLDTHLDIIDATRRQISRMADHRLRYSRSGSSIAVFGAYLADPDAAAGFVEQVVSGQDADPAAWVFREWALRQKDNPARLGTEVYQAVLIHMWNKWILGEPASQVRPRDAMKVHGVLNAEGDVVFPIPE